MRRTCSLNSDQPFPEEAPCILSLLSEFRGPDVLEMHSQQSHLQAFLLFGHTHKLTPDSIVYTDTFRSYNALDMSKFKHYRINHSVLFADKHNHINGIENFWNQAKRHLRKFNGIAKGHFPLVFEGV